MVPAAADNGVMRPEATGPAVPNAFQIRLLGSFAVLVDGRPADAAHWRLRKARALVAMLALEPGQSCRRDQVLDRLWPGMPPVAAARNLHQTAYVARRTLSDLGLAGESLLVLSGDRVVLSDRGQVDVDVLAFEREAARALASGGEPELRQAAALYTGDLLPDLPDDLWLAGRRRELSVIGREVQLKLVSAIGHRAPEEAMLIVTRVLAADRLHEGAVRAEMELLARLGRHSEALSRYEILVEGLLDEFGTDPDEQTARLFRNLLVQSPPTDRSPAVRPPGADDNSRVPDDRTGALPLPASSFIGRSRELADVTRLLDHARLLTLTGVGGGGKTRLALETARRVRRNYRDGVWYVGLATVVEPRSVACAVASVLRLDATGPSGREGALVDSLRRASILIVLDNCEHLLAACAHLVTLLLEGCPGVTILATSRELLHAPGEYTFRVPSLSLPSPVGGGGPDLVQMGHRSAVRLFVERAAQARWGFALTAENARAVTDICRRLDGVPLALELAAARIAVLEPAELVARLDHALAVLDSATRHQVLRGVMEWSFTLLSEPEQVLFRRLSVFAGGFTLEAAEAVCGFAPLRQTEILDLLAALVDKSLVGRVSSGDLSRFRLLEVVRQFGQEYLERAGETTQLATAHCGHFLEFAETHNPERATGIIREAPRLLDDEHDNLRAALRWSISHAPESALRLAASLWRFWFVRGHSVEGARWVEQALAAAPEPTRPRAAALIGLTGLDSRQGRGDRHRSLGAEAVAIMRLIGTPDEIVMARLIDATLTWSTFDLPAAEKLISDVRSEAAERDRPDYVAASSWLLGHCALSREDGPAAALHLAACLDELTRCAEGSAPFLPVITPSLQLVPVRGRLLPCIEETLLLGRRVGAAQGFGHVQAAVGYAARLSSDWSTATAVLSEAIERFTEQRDDLALGQVVHQLGCVLRDLGDHEGADQMLSRAGALRRALGDRRGELLTELNHALLRAISGDLGAGLDAAARGLAAFETAGDPVGVGAALGVLGAGHLLAGELRLARDLYSQSAAQLVPWRRHAGWQRIMAAELSSELGDKRQAAREFARAKAAFGRTRCVVASARLAAIDPGADHGD